MFKTTKTHFQWTETAEKRWQHHEIESRRAGEMLTEIDGRGYRVKRQTVPLTWIQKGYVREAEEEQIDLFDMGV